MTARHEQVQPFLKLPVFSRLTADEEARLASLVKERSYREGEIVFAEGDPRARLLLIQKGQVELSRTDAYGVRRKVVTLTRGDVLGDGMFIEGSVHSTTATAVTNTELVYLHRDQLPQLTNGDLALEKRMLSSLLNEVVGRVDQLLFRTSGVTHAYSTGKTRMEHDLLGDGPVQQEAYFGLQTVRALVNFDICGVRLNAYPHLIRALAMVKKACAFANRDSGALDAERTSAIASACDELIAGKLHDYFVVDVIQGGAGTSTNMNANEVIANRALELLGAEKGDYERQFRAHAARLAFEVTTTVTHLGYQFPGGSGPGRLVQYSELGRGSTRPPRPRRRGWRSASPVCFGDGMPRQRRHVRSALTARATFQAALP
jgi:aspartate ammonia-lyase